jgi:hypothetical protein
MIEVTELANKAVLVLNEVPKNCKECLLHILMLKSIHTKEEIFSCAGYKGRGTLNPECDFLNNFDDYSKTTAPNCPLVFDVIRIMKQI